MNSHNLSLSKPNKLPRFIQDWARDNFIGRTVKFVGTAGIHFEKMTLDEVLITLPSQSKEQNHNGQIHAAATTLTYRNHNRNGIRNEYPRQQITSDEETFGQIRQTRHRSTNSYRQTIRIANKFNLKYRKRRFIYTHPNNPLTGEEVVLKEMIWA